MQYERASKNEGCWALTLCFQGIETHFSDQDMLTNVIYIVRLGRLSRVYFSESDINESFGKAMFICNGHILFLTNLRYPLESGAVGFGVKVATLFCSKIARQKATLESRRYSSVDKALLFFVLTFTPVRSRATSFDGTAEDTIFSILSKKLICGQGSS